MVQPEVLRIIRSQRNWIPRDGHQILVPLPDGFNLSDIEELAAVRLRETWRVPGRKPHTVRLRVALWHTEADSQAMPGALGLAQAVSNALVKSGIVASPDAVWKLWVEKDQNPDLQSPVLSIFVGIT